MSSGCGRRYGPAFIGMCTSSVVPGAMFIASFAGRESRHTDVLLSLLFFSV